VATTVLINMGRARYVWVTVLPMAFVATTTLTAGWQSIWQNFLPLAAQPGKLFVGSVNVVLILIMMGCAMLMIGHSALRWKKVLCSPLGVLRTEEALTPD